VLDIKCVIYFSVQFYWKRFGADVYLANAPNARGNPYSLPSCKPGISNPRSDLVLLNCAYSKLQ
jgi:hypothetical protein